VGPDVSIRVPTVRNSSQGSWGAQVRGRHENKYQEKSGKLTNEPPNQAHAKIYIDTPEYSLFVQQESTTEGLQRDGRSPRRESNYLIIFYHALLPRCLDLLISAFSHHGLWSRNMVSYTSTRAFIGCRRCPLESAEGSGGKNDGFRWRRKGLSDFPILFLAPTPRG
jgi:hypothetical protein